MFCARLMARCSAIVLAGVAVCLSPADATTVLIEPIRVDQIAAVLQQSGAQCAIEEVVPIPRPVRPKVRRPARHGARLKAVHHSHVRRRRQPVRIWAPVRPPQRPYIWNCSTPIFFAQPGMEPFTTDFTNIMTPVEANDSFQQWIIDRHMRRSRRYFEAGRAFAAPEPEAWLMFLIGFGLIGFTMRRARLIPPGTGSAGCDSSEAQVAFQSGAYRSSGPHRLSKLMVFFGVDRLRNQPVMSPPPPEPKKNQASPDRRHSR